VEFLSGGKRLTRFISSAVGLPLPFRRKARISLLMFFVFVFEKIFLFLFLKKFLIETVSGRLVDLVVSTTAEEFQSQIGGNCD